MSNILFMVCPTDHIEMIISNSFKRYFFYTSLGNSFEFDDYTIGQIKLLISANDIREVIYICCSDNRIVKDAISKQQYRNISGLRNFYNRLKSHKTKSFLFETEKDHLQWILSEHLNFQINTLKEKLKGADDIEIKGLIYDRELQKIKNTLNPIFSKQSLHMN
ncbi:hypothetical protein [Sphingobacterium spiritivorum]|uniref:hypothetical protein n=1 Tax=Sphingobacterium spiritivorum TaxID=258 RepID=UPI00191B2001|nr:hypothetical protein [Sphingobacterium spiritivorum]QQT26904.1 hypothetical protein I6J02_03285 [Sphingobacterium spiritivorum]